MVAMADVPGPQRNGQRTQKRMRCVLAMFAGEDVMSNRLAVLG